MHVGILQIKKNNDLLLPSNFGQSQTESFIFIVNCQSTAAAITMLWRAFDAVVEQSGDVELGCSFDQQKNWVQSIVKNGEDEFDEAAPAAASPAPSYAPTLPSYFGSAAAPDTAAFASS